jgi:endonuclease/exonuclease/phosphatase family metal-dependent hydrolase
MNNKNKKTLENLGTIIATYKPDICCIQEAAPDIGATVNGYTSSVTKEHNGKAGKGLEISWNTVTFNLAQGGSHYSGYSEKNTPYRVILTHKTSGTSFNITTWHASGEKYGNRYAHSQPCLQGYYNQKPGEIGQAVTNDGFWIVAGDFNMTATELRGCQFGRKDTYEAVHNTSPYKLDHVIAKTQVGEMKRVKIDDSLIEEDNPTFGSDVHRPLIVEISW